MGCDRSLTDKHPGNHAVSAECFGDRLAAFREELADGEPVLAA